MRPGPAAAHPGHPGHRQRAARVAAAGRRCARSAARSTCRTTPSNLDGVDTVVYSTAIPQDHLELVEARSRGLRVLHRSEALAAAMVGRRAIAVAGTHGKTTTTSMMTRGPAARRAGPVVRDRRRDLRGRLQRPPRHRRRTSWSRPTRATGRSCATGRSSSIITNIDADHLNTYGDLAGAGGGVRGVRRADRAGRVRGHLRRQPGHARAGRQGCAPAG